MGLLSLIALTACGAQPQKNTNKEMNTGKTLVVYFSHAGENYSVGNVKEGNTKLVADVICAQTGADRFEIECVKDYNMGYAALCDLAKVEQQNGELPGFKGEVANIADYSTIYIGGPVWWGTYPQVMFTFFKQYDLNGKTIIPFTTHEGSGLGNCVSDLKAIYPNATFGKAFSIYGHEARTDAGKKKIENWVKGN